MDLIELGKLLRETGLGIAIFLMCFYIVKCMLHYVESYLKENNSMFKKSFDSVIANMERQVEKADKFYDKVREEHDRSDVHHKEIMQQHHEIMKYSAKLNEQHDEMIKALGRINGYRKD